MAQTYTISPISIPSIFEAIVGTVSDNLASATIPQVSFRHGTWIDILDELTIDSSSPDDDVKNNKYPLVCLIHQFDEKPFDAQSEDAEFTLIIVTRSTATMRTDERYSVNFIPILYPIYAELKQVISDSMYFLGYNQNFSHTKRDLTHAGQESANGNTAYKLPDVLDGLLMANIKLRVNLDPICEPATPNLCLLTPCPYGLELYDYNAFTDVSFEGIGTAIITASVNDFAYLYGGAGLPAPFAPEVSWQGGAYVAMTVPTPPALVPYTLSFDVTTGLGDGFYIGEIRFGDAHVQFYYEVSGGVVIKLTSSILQTIDFSVSCADYPDYPITVDFTYLVDTFTTEPPILDRYVLDVFGVNKVDESFALTDEFERETETTTVHLLANKSIINTVYSGSHVSMENKSIYKTRCKTEF